MPGNDSPITQRDLTNLTSAISKLEATIEKFRDVTERDYVRKDVFEPKFQGLREDVDKHSEWFTWAARLVVGAVILGLLAVVIQTGGTG